MKSTKLLLVFAFLFSFYSDSEIKQSDFRVESTSIQTNKNNTENCTQQITGTVLDRETKKPLVNALVTLFINNEESKLVKVNSKGEYTITINCNTDYKIIATSNNFFSETYKFKTTSKDNDKISYNFLLDKECYQMITGTVLNQLSKEAIDKVKTTLYLNGEETDSFIVNSTGKYEFKVRCNTNYYIMANKLNFINDIYEFSSSKINNEIIKHDFILEPECIQTISGTVFNKVTKEPLSCELKLYLNNVEVETINVNNDGSYFVKFQCTTNYKIIASKPNYHNDSYNFLTDYIENKQPDYFHLKKDLFLEPDECFQIVMGKVLDKNTHKEIPNTTVSLIFQNQEIKTFETNSDASYFFTVKCGLLYELKATKEGKQSAIINYTASLAKDDKKTQNIYLENEICNQIVNGTVIDKVTKLPLANTKVSLLENNNEVNSTYTNTNGTFNFTINCESSYKIVAANSEYNSNSIVFETNKTRNETTSKSIELTPLDCNQIVNGTVIDKVTKLPLANTKVSLLENNNEVNSTYTNTNGTFNFTINCESSYKIVAANSEYNSNSIVFETNKTRNETTSKSIELTPLDCNQIVNGTVIDKVTKLPLANTKVSLLENNNEVNSTYTNTNGTFNFTINCESSYKIVAANSEYNSNSIVFETNKTRNETTSKSIELTPLDCNQIVNGTVIDKVTKLPLANTKVSLLENNNEVNSTYTNTNGTFNFTINCESSYKIVAANSEYNSNSIVFETNKTRNETTSKSIELTPLDCNQIVNGTVIDKVTKLPLANTKVSLLENNNEVNSTYTNTNGTFNFTINCDSSYKIVAANNLYFDETVNIVSNNNRNTEQSITLSLIKKECKQTVTGIIRDKISKKPLPNSTISLYQNDKVIDTYTVGNDGVYQFDLECSSTYKLTVFKNNNLESFRLKTAAENGRTLTLHIEIEPLVCIQYINGVVSENISKNPIPNATITLLNITKDIEKTTTDSNGTFYFEIECDKSYTLKVEKENYTNASLNLNSTGKSAYAHTIEFVIEPIIQISEKNGIRFIETKPIDFELDEYEITDENKIELNKIVFNMNQNPSIKIEINYHTDSRGPDAYNLQLTINRANATKDYLISKGISADRIKANGFGETQLLNKCKNDVKCTDAEHLENRRTEFIVKTN